MYSYNYTLNVQLLCGQGVASLRNVNSRSWFFWSIFIITNTMCDDDHCHDCLDQDGDDDDHDDGLDWENGENHDDDDDEMGSQQLQWSSANL